MDIARGLQGKRDTYRADIVRDGIKLLRCLEERRNPIDQVGFLLFTSAQVMDWTESSGHNREDLERVSFRYEVGSDI